MTGLLIQLAISWLLLWLFERKHLPALGLAPATTRLIQFFIGFGVAIVCCTLYYWSFSFGADNKWVVNNAFTVNAFAKSLWVTLKSVLFEELIFRGAILYILLRRMKMIYACLISAIAFGIYHWFTMGFGNPVQMIFIFITTGIWGYMFAMAFAKTGSMYLPIGIHFGWNLFNNVIFSQGPQGEQFLLLEGSEKIEGLLSLFIYLFQLLAVPLFIFWYLKKTKPRKFIYSSGNE